MNARWKYTVEQKNANRFLPYVRFETNNLYIIHIVLVRTKVLYKKYIALFKSLWIFREVYTLLSMCFMAVNVIVSTNTASFRRPLPLNQQYFDWQLQVTLEVWINWWYEFRRELFRNRLSRTYVITHNAVFLYGLKLLANGPRKL